MEKIILASSSPRRKELLDLLGIPFIVHPSSKEEDFNNDDLPVVVVEKLALMKAGDIALHYNEGIVIGADTIVVLDNHILGKPDNEEEAFFMLKRLQGEVHQVYSGVAIVNAKTKESLVSHRMTKVYMKHLNDEEINWYIKTKEPMDKAGSYGIQGIGAIFIDKIEGDFFNVVGLPLSLLADLLKSFEANIIHPKSKV